MKNTQEKEYIVMQNSNSFGFEIARFNTEQEAIEFAECFDWEIKDENDFVWFLTIIQ